MNYLLLVLVGINNCTCYWCYSVLLINLLGSYKGFINESAILWCKDLFYKGTDEPTGSCSSTSTKSYDTARQRLPCSNSERIVLLQKNVMMIKKYVELVEEALQDLVERSGSPGAKELEV